MISRPWLSWYCERALRVIPARIAVQALLQLFGAWRPWTQQIYLVEQRQPRLLFQTKIGQDVLDRLALLRRPPASQAGAQVGRSGLDPGGNSFQMPHDPPFRHQDSP